MDLASAPVRPGFVLAWIVAVTGSAFLVMNVICPPAPGQAASADPIDPPPAATRSTDQEPAPGSPAAPETLRSVSPVSEGDPLDFLQADPENELEQDPGAEAAAPTATATVAQPDHPAGRGMPSLALPTSPQVLPAGVAFGPLVLEWSHATALGDEDEDDEVQIQVVRAGRGLYLMRLLLSRYQELGLDALPAELLEALPAKLISQLDRPHAEGGEGSTAESGNDEGGRFRGARRAWKRAGADSRQRVQAKGRELLLLLSEEQLQRLRQRMLENQG